MIDWMYNYGQKPIQEFIFEAIYWIGIGLVYGV
jgi:hypothetical protein